MAPGGAAADAPWIALVLGTALIVGAANTLNMYLEREVNGLMARTRTDWKILPTTRGEATTRQVIILSLAVQVQVSLLLTPLGVAGLWYLFAAALLGAAYFAYALYGLTAGGPRWARNLFLSLDRLPAAAHGRAGPRPDDLRIRRPARTRRGRPPRC